MSDYNIFLNELIQPGLTDSISGRTFGEDYAKKKHNLLFQIESGNKIIINIDNQIKVINDSFWKGFFNIVFKKYKSKDIVSNFFEIKSNEYFQNQILNNFIILDSIYNV